jgi:hypothetical protein
VPFHVRGANRLSQGVAPQTLQQRYVALPNAISLQIHGRANMSSGTGAFAPVHAFTPDDHGAIVTVTSFNCIFTLVTVILVRIWISVRRKLPPLDDDLWLVIAVVILTYPLLPRLTRILGSCMH